MFWRGLSSRILRCNGVECTCTYWYNFNLREESGSVLSFWKENRFERLMVYVHFNIKAILFSGEMALMVWWLSQVKWSTSRNELKPYIQQFNTQLLWFFAVDYSDSTCKTNFCNFLYTSVARGEVNFVPLGYQEETFCGLFGKSEVSNTHRYISYGVRLRPRSSAG